jgi:hypothetical protein
MHDHSWRRRHVRKGWIDILQEYSKKKMTNLTDKLPALAGIASEIAAARPDQEYLGGVWRSNLVEELAWAADYTNKTNVHVPYAKVKPPTNRLANHPTWLWASMHFVLCFRPGPNAVSHTELVDVDIGPAITEDHESAQSNDVRTMTVRGKLGRLRIQRTSNRKLAVLRGQLDPGTCIFEPRWNFLDRKNREPFNTDVVLIDTETDLDLIQNYEVECLSWIEWSQDGREYVGVMIIAPTGRREHEYRRIGWADLTKSSILDAGENSTITLV